MATTYFLTTTAASLDPGAESWSNEVQEATPSTTTLVSTIANGDGMAGTIDSSDYAFTPAADPGAIGTTGNYQLRVEVNTGDANVTLIPQLARVNSGGTVQSGPTGSDGGGQTASAGTLTFNWTSLNLGTWAAGDRLRITFGWDNASTHGGAEVITQNIGSAGTDIDAPWNSPISRSHTALVATPTLGTHDNTWTRTATGLNAAPTYGTHYAITSPIANSPAPALWLDASNAATISATGNNLDSWTSAEGYGYAFDDCASGAGGNPQTGTATINGLNVIDFATGTRYAEWLDVGGRQIVNGSKGYVFIVFTENSGVNNLYYVLGISEDGSATTKYGFGVATNVNSWRGPPITVTRWNSGGTDTNFGGSKGNRLAGNTTTLSVARSTGSAYETRRNGFSLDPVSVSIGTDDGDWFSLAPALDRATIGAIRFGSPTPITYFPLDGYVAEILIYDDVDLSAGELAAIESYLIAKWAIPLAPVPAALAASATYGTHAASLATSATALAATPTLGSHIASITSTQGPTSTLPDLWLRAGLQLVTSGSDVVRWQDQSGNSRHFTQDTAGKYPTTRSLNGYAGPDFDGTDDVLVLTGNLPMLAASGEIIVVWEADTTGANALLFAEADTAAGQHFIGVGNMGWINPNRKAGEIRHRKGATDSSVVGSNYTHVINTPYVTSFRYDSGTQIEQDGQPQTEAVAFGNDSEWFDTINAGASLDVASVGALRFNVSAQSLHFNGAIYEVLAYDGAVLSASERQEVYARLAERYALDFYLAATALAASATLGTHEASTSYAATATALAVGTLGTHAASLDVGATALAATIYGTHEASTTYNAAATALATTTYGTHAADLVASATALASTVTLGTHACSFGTTANHTALAASATLGTHAVQLQAAATALVASPALGTHAADLAAAATALAASAALGTHAASVQAGATALAAAPTLGTHAAQLQANAAALAATPTLGTHAWSYSGLTANATALQVGTLGTHAASLLASATALTATPTLGMHAAQLGTPATALAATPTLGTHAIQLQASATALAAAPTLGTHSWSSAATRNATALNAAPTLGTHAASLQLGAAALAAAATLGTHTAPLLASASALAAAPTLGTHSISWGAQGAALAASATLGTHSASLQLGAAALDASPTLGTHSTAVSYPATALAVSPVLGTHSVALAAAVTRVVSLGGVRTTLQLERKVQTSASALAWSVRTTTMVDGEVLA